MDKSAIEQIQLGKQIENANNALTAQKLAALPNDFVIHNLEQYEESRNRFRGLMSTKSVTAFASYAKSKNKNGTACFINADEMNATAIFNFGDEETPGHCDNKAIVQLEQTAPYIALNKIIGSQLSQKSVAEFIEDWRDFITCFGQENEDGERDAIKIPKALHAIRSITIEAIAKSQSDDRDFGASKSTMESIDVKSDNMPPAIIVFTCTPYKELPAREFALRLGVLTDRSPMLTLRLIKAETHKEEMAEEFKAVIEKSLEQFDPKIPTFIGTFKS